jgi:hypothetical protein
MTAGPRSAPILAALVLVALSASCGHGSTPGAAPSASAPPASRSAEGEAPPAAPASPLGPGALTNPNPLDLPQVKVSLDAGRRVFAPSGQMLATLRPGSTLVLYAATALGVDGDDLILEGRGGPSYKIHAGYVIPVPDEPRIVPGTAVLTEHGGVMRHAVVTKMVKDRVFVRFTDVDHKPAEVSLLGGSGKPIGASPSKAARFVRKVDGLVPGNLAALRQGDEWLHVLLVSAGGEGAGRRWFALGYGGAAMVVKESDLRPIPVRFSPRVGGDVWAQWAGKMRRATVLGADDQGLFTVKFDRAGRPAVTGWGFLMPPPPE